MNFRTLVGLIFLAVLLTGCAAASVSLQAVTVTPDIMPRLDPSPTPSGSSLPLTCQVTDLNVYVNEAEGYCFAYPLGFTLGDQPSDKPEVRGPAVDDSVEPIHAMFRVELAPAADQSLREGAEAYLKDFSVAGPATFTWTQLQVGGEAAWMVEPIPVMLSWRIVFVQHNRQIFHLMYWPVDILEAQANLDELTQTTLGSFAFTK